MLNDDWMVAFADDYNQLYFYCRVPLGKQQSSEVAAVIEDATITPPQEVVPLVEGIPEL